MTVGILVMAAGRARRFGSDKRLATLPDGRRSIEALLDQLDASGLPALVCLGPNDTEVAAILDSRGFPWQFCQRSPEGMGGTLAEGIVCAGAWKGALIALADMPWIKGGTYKAVADQLDEGSICVPTFAGRRGHPVGFGRRYFSEIAKLTGDTGARSLLQKFQANVMDFVVDDPGILQDIDSPEDISSRAG